MSFFKKKLLNLKFIIMKLDKVKSSQVDEKSPIIIFESLIPLIVWLVSTK